MSVEQEMQNVVKCDIVIKIITKWLFEINSSARREFVGRVSEKYRENNDVFYKMESVISGNPCVHERNKQTGRAVYYISDLHTECKAKKGFEGVTDSRYIDHVISKMNGGNGDEPLLIAGDISDFSLNVDYFFCPITDKKKRSDCLCLG
ncbi:MULTISPECIES: hypothetical protein [unclassified Candidatus Paralachnospira]|uniref:hypothetical protein n=1 Tax=unclassified Candidatus Paralachnospira TaxID=3099471 RepID=UPI003F93CF45